MKRSRTASVGATQDTVMTTASKKRYSSKKSFSVPYWAGRPKTGFPKQLRIRHRYVDNITLVSTTGALASQSFRCNGMFDPDYTSTGHQPLYFDQLSAIYNHFTVLNSKITVKFYTVTSAVVPMSVAMFINDDATVTPSGPAAQAEQSSARFGMVPGGANQQLTLTSKWSATQAFGPGALSDPNLQGNSAGDPTEQQLWSIQARSADLASTQTLYAQVLIEYDAVWQELKDIAGS